MPLYPCCFYPASVSLTMLDDGPKTKVAVANLCKQNRGSNPVICFLIVVKVTLQLCVCTDYGLCVHVGCHYISECQGLMSGLYDAFAVLTLEYCFFYTLRCLWVCNSRDWHATLFATTVPCDSCCCSYHQQQQHCIFLV